MTQRDLARRLNVSNTTISEWENASNTIQPDSLHAIAQILQVSVSDFYGNEPVHQENVIAKPGSSQDPADPLYYCLTSGDLEFPVVLIPHIAQVTPEDPYILRENITSYEPVRQEELGSGRFFCWTMQDDSMTGARIYSGDQLLLRMQTFAEAGQIILASVDNSEPVLRRLHRDAAGHRLMPENPNFHSIPVKKSSLQIIGIVTRVNFRLL